MDEEQFVPKRRAKGRMSTFVMVVMVITTAVGAFWLGVRGREQIDIYVIGQDSSVAVPPASSAPRSPRDVELN